MTAEDEGRTGVDALMAAITEEPLTDATRADAAFMAEHSRAVADLALLREQLGIIGQALAEPPAPAAEPAPVPVRRPAGTRRRAFRLALGTLAVAAAASVVAGLGWLAGQAGGGGSAAGSAADSAASKQSETGSGSSRYLACARLVAEGDVIAVESVPGTAQQRVTLRVSRSYQPEKSEAEVTFRMEQGSVARGEHILVGIPRGAAAPDLVAVGEREIAPERAWITASLAQSRKLTC
ncbi:hypothetical protein [Streptomyces sp. NPDC098781]|uniref:hypothetical protein n=1 Tax=Streptomyces sp. NPDC098781 TaxID=3366097 RepID=UPI00382212F5